MINKTPTKKDDSVVYKINEYMYIELELLQSGRFHLEMLRFICKLDTYVTRFPVEMSGWTVAYYRTKVLNNRNVFLFPLLIYLINNYFKSE